ncbi:MAG: DNA mismatch repair endonuclease MutL [Gammaproteobacteria bacterium]
MILGRIQRLPVQVINKIAAGEVIERPASVVKELIENSLDAGARSIFIDVERAGVRLLRVRDDGCGIHPQDLALALDRHATSKISRAEQLEHIYTLGFRGEALSSIGAVAKLTLTSRTNGETLGARVQADGGLARGPMEPTVHPLGTTVDVRDLFYNTPARRRFLCGERTELHHLVQTAKRCALSRFEVGFRCTHGQRQLLHLAPVRDESGRATRIAAILGRNFLTHALLLDEAATGLHLWGWLGLPETAGRYPEPLQYFYLNGRNIRDTRVNHAIRRAFSEQLERDQHPAYVLYLDLDPAEVDVNVHPSKREVRYRDPRLVHDFIYATAHRALYRPPVSPLPAVSENTSGCSSTRIHAVSEPAWAEPPACDNPATDLTVRARPGRLGKAIGLIKGRFLLAENEQGLLIIDTTRGKIATCYQRLTEESRSPDGVRTRPLLIPQVLEVDEALAQLAERFSDLLFETGVGMSRVGKRSVILRLLPMQVTDLEWNRLVLSLLNTLSCYHAEDVADLKERLFRRLSEHTGSVDQGLNGHHQMNVWLRELESFELGTLVASRQIGEQELADLCAGSAGEGAEMHVPQRARSDDPGL